MAESRKSYCLALLLALFATTTVFVEADILNTKLEFPDFKNELQYEQGALDAEETTTIPQVGLPYDHIRLPTHIVPLKYNIYLHPNITDGTFQYTGSTRILLTVKEETNLIVFHSVKLNHIWIDVLAENGTELDISATWTSQKNQQTILQLKDNLLKGKKYTLYVIFASELNDGLMGFYRSSYKTTTGEIKYLATTQFEATGARLAFPCFDEPAFKAKFSIAIVREGIHNSLSNMPIQRTYRRPDDLFVDHFVESVDMSTYLVAFIVSDFVSVSTKTERGIKVSIWAPKQHINQTGYALHVAPKILNYYEKFFNVPFPLPKMDLIGIPDFGAGAMENWGLVTYRMRLLLVDEHECTIGDRKSVAFVIAHELAHQWFGNLVTMKWWRDLWLNEGFASFVMYIGANLIGPTWNTMDGFVSTVHSALAADSRRNTHPISVAVNNPAEIGGLFDAISYSKGASVIRMMWDFIGHEKFVHGLSDYLKKHKFGNAESDDLWASLAKQMDEPGLRLGNVMHQWTLQKGYPLISVIRHGNKVFLTQKRFVSDAQQMNGDISSTQKLNWTIPMKYYSQKDNKIRRIWFPNKETSVTLTLPDTLGWLKLNAEEFGFYRVNYDLDNWKALTHQLNTAHTDLHPTDRANLIDDAFHLAEAGVRKYSLALDLTRYLHKERDYVALNTGISSLTEVGRRLVSRPGYKMYEKYLLQRILPFLDEIGWEDEGSDQIRVLRGNMLKLALQHNDEKTKKQGRSRCKDWRSGKWIPPNIREAVYMSCLVSKGVYLRNLIHTLNTTTVPSVKYMALRVLASLSDPDGLYTYLEMIIAFAPVIHLGKMKPQDNAYFIERIAENHNDGGGAVRQFLGDYWDHANLPEKFGTSRLPSVLRAAFGMGKTEEDLRAAETFFRKHKLHSAKYGLKGILASIQSNMAWLKRFEKDVNSWFQGL